MAGKPNATRIGRNALRWAIAAPVLILGAIGCAVLLGLAYWLVLVPLLLIGALATVSDSVARIGIREGIVK